MQDFPDILACPNCKGPVVREANSFYCPRCHRHYPVRDGYIDLMLQ